MMLHFMACNTSDGGRPGRYQACCVHTSPGASGWERQWEMDGLSNFNMHPRQQPLEHGVAMHESLHQHWREGAGGRSDGGFLDD